MIQRYVVTGYYRRLPVKSFQFVGPILLDRGDLFIHGNVMLWMRRFSVSARKLTFSK